MRPAAKAAELPPDPTAGAPVLDSTDLVRLDDAGIAAKAFADRALAQAVARHKAAFFLEKDAAGERIDYEAAVSAGLRLVPDGPTRDVLADDYRRMTEDGMLLDDGERFEEIMEQCAGIKDRANRTG